MCYLIAISDGVLPSFLNLLHASRSLVHPFVCLFLSTIRAAVQYLVYLMLCYYILMDKIFVGDIILFPTLIFRVRPQIIIRLPLLPR